MPDDQSTDLQTSRIGSFDPETGERTYREFKYRPGPISKPIQPSPMDSLMRAAQQVYQTAPLEDAERAVSAAIQYQGLRAYQRDLAGGMSANEALVRNGPMMFYQRPSAIAPMLEQTAPMPKPNFVPIPGQPGAQFATFGKTGHVIQPQKSTAAIQNIDEIMATEQRAQQALQSGNTVLATQLQERAAMIREQMKGQQIVMGYDDQGRPIFQIGKGASPTVATASRAQQKLQKYENATEIINRLQGGLEAGHVGVAGMAGEFLWDRGLVQLLNLMGNQTAQANPERVNSRAGLIMLRESLMREISDDPRFSNLDREEISKALPSSGAFESLSDAKQKLSTVREIMGKRAKVYAGSINMPSPLWALSPEEIKAQFKQGKINRQQAIEALTRYH